MPRPAGEVKRYNLEKYMKEISNRSAILVTPKKPFNEWAELYNDETEEDLNERMNEKRTYLIEWTFDEDFSEILESYYLKIFEYELSMWNVYKHEWPQDRSIKNFKKWFNVILSDELIDMKKEKIVYEKL